MTPAQRRALVQERTRKLHRLLVGAAVLVAVQLTLLNSARRWVAVGISAGCCACCVLILNRVNGLERKD